MNYADFKEAFKKQWLTWLIGSVVIAGLLYVFITSSDTSGEVLGALVTLGLAVFFIRIIFVFTSRLDENNPEETHTVLMRMVRLAYYFGFFFLFIVLLPLLMMLPGLMREGVDEERQANVVKELSVQRISSGPFFVTKACTHVAEDEPQATELSCEKGHAQWVFNFGGVPSLESVRTVEGVNRQEHFVHLSGGLVLPVYFIFIAVAGAVVGMLRRIPEIQRRAYQGVNGDEGAEVDPENAPISIGVAREQLIFQIVQVVTAPFIAILAYVTVEPVDHVATTAIAFISGFSAEPFLAVVRDITNRISGPAV